MFVRNTQEGEFASSLDLHRALLGQKPHFCSQFHCHLPVVPGTRSWSNSSVVLRYAPGSQGQPSLTAPLHPASLPLLVSTALFASKIRGSQLSRFLFSRQISFTCQSCRIQLPPSAVLQTARGKKGFLFPFLSS